MEKYFIILEKYFLNFETILQFYGNYVTILWKIKKKEQK